MNCFLYLFPCIRDKKKKFLTQISRLLIERGNKFKSVIFKKNKRMKFWRVNFGDR